MSSRRRPRPSVFCRPDPVSPECRAHEPRRVPPSNSKDNTGNNGEPQPNGCTVESSDAKTDPVHIKRGGETRVSSEEEVLTHTTASGLDPPKPRIAAINSSRSPTDEDSEDEDEIGADEKGRQSTDPPDDDADRGEPHCGLEGDNPNARNESPPVHGDDTHSNGDGEGKSNVAAARQAGVDGASQNSAEPSGSSKQPKSSHQTTPPEFVPPENEDDDDEKFAPHLLFSQSRNFSASQVQRRLATELSVRYNEEEEDRTAVKEQSPSSLMTLRDLLPTGLRPKDSTPPDVEYIMIDSSSELESPKKGPLKRPAEATTPMTLKRSRREPTPFPPQRKPEERREIPIHEFRRDEDLWYLDGSVVIQIHDRAFRLHESLLSEKFTYFKALFGSGHQPTRMIDNTPVYEVEGNADDFKKLHRYMQDPWDADESFHGLAPVARAAHLYGMQGALRHVAKRLNEIYPQEYVGSRGHSFAAEAIVLADNCPTLAFMTKPAMYDLLCQPEFRFPPSTTDRGKGDVFSVPRSRVLQLLAARNALQGQWQSICSPESCLGDFDAEPTNKCRCFEIFADEAIHADFTEAEVMECKTRRHERMLAVWFRKLYSPPTPPAPKDPQDVPARKPKKRQSTQSGGNGARPNKKQTQTVPVANAAKPIITTGNTDIILGLELLSKEGWEDLECVSCLSKRRKKWGRKQEQVWKMLNGLFDVEAGNDDDF